MRGTAQFVFGNGTSDSGDAEFWPYQRDPETLAPLVAGWEGQAATEYQAKQRQWDAAAAAILSSS